MSRGVAVISAKANNVLRTQRDALAGCLHHIENYF